MPFPLVDLVYLTSAALALAAAIPFYVLFARGSFAIHRIKRVLPLFLIWLALFAVEYYILGPYSFTEKTVEANLNVALNHYLVHFHDGGILAREWGGGQDVYTILFGTQPLNLDRFLIGLLPTWTYILTHKVMVATIGFTGAFLLARRFSGGSVAIAAVLAMLFPVSHVYLLNWSTNYSPGFSILPLVVYLCITRSRDSRYWTGVAFAAVLVALSEPIHVLPALAVTLAGAAILHENPDLRRTLIAAMLMAVAALLNWHEELYAYVQNIGLTSRGAGADQDVGKGVASVLLAMPATAYGRAPVPVSIALPSFVLLLLFRRTFLPRAVGCFLLPIAVVAASKAFPWQFIGLGFLNRYEHAYMLYALIPLAIPIAAAAIATAPSLAWKFRGHRSVDLIAATGAAALALMVMEKANNAAIWAWFGGQPALWGHSELVDPDWRPDEPFRVVAPFESPHPNIVAGFYGLEVYDGQYNINPLEWDRYWNAIIANDVPNWLGPRIGKRMEFWNGSTYEIGRQVNLDLLGMANVRYIVSPLPLSAPGLRPIRTVDRENWPFASPHWFAGWGDFLAYRWRRVFDPGSLHIYELPRVLPRAYAALSLAILPDSSPDDAVIAAVSRVAFGREVVVREKDAALLPRPAGELQVLDVHNARNGYDVSVHAPVGGVVVVNTLPSPFWRARSDGTDLAVVPANFVQVAIAVPPGTRSIELRLQRPLLRDRILELARHMIHWP